MKEILLQYIRYNYWANEHMTNLLDPLIEDEYTKSLGGSFDTIEKTVAHIWMAESVWLQRLQMKEHIQLPPNPFQGSLKEMCAAWLQEGHAWIEFVEKIYDARGCEHVFHYTSLDGQLHKSAVWECIHHVCNHSTFHRSQLIQFLRQLGYQKLTSTDFITFCRLKK